MSTSLAMLVPELREGAMALLEEARAAGLAPQITSTRRTYAEQKALYEKFLRGDSAYPASPPGVGSHETGEAFDMVVTPMEYLADLGDLWESWGGRWGGVWRNPDVIHFELMGASERARAHPVGPPFNWWELFVPPQLTTEKGFYSKVEQWWLQQQGK